MPSRPAITGAQIRAARAFLNWTVEDLSRRCGVSASAISRAERVDGPPPMQLRNLAAIRIAFERNGIELIDDVGVKLRRA
jgi:transcriptional regulator with XRE-family HTH domain